MFLAAVITLASSDCVLAQRSFGAPPVFRFEFAKIGDGFELTGAPFTQEHAYSGKVITNVGTLYELKRLEKSAAGDTSAEVVWRALAFTPTGESRVRHADLVFHTNRHEMFLALSRGGGVGIYRIDLNQSPKEIPNRLDMSVVELSRGPAAASDVVQIPPEVSKQLTTVESVKIRVEHNRIKLGVSTPNGAVKEFGLPIPDAPAPGQTRQ